MGPSLLRLGKGNHDLSKNKRGGSLVTRYASILLMAYALSDMLVGLATRTGYSMGDILVVFLAGYLFFRSKFARGISQDFMVVGVAFILLFTVGH